MSGNGLTWKTVGYAIGSATIFAITTSIGASVWILEKSWDGQMQQMGLTDQKLQSRIDGTHTRIEDLKDYVDNKDGSLIEMDRTINKRLDAYAIGEIPREQ